MERVPRNRTAPPVTDDLHWCHEAVQGVSRTFALTIDVLDDPMSSYICVGYLLCRVADTVEDAGHIPADEQAALLRSYDAALDPEGDVGIEVFLDDVEPWLPPEDERDEDWRVVAESERVFRAFERQPPAVRAAITPPVRELVSGMALFVDRYADRGGLRIQSGEELEEYCHYAAGTVGQLITNLVCRDGVPRGTRERLYGTAESFGLLLQLVNISKDVYDDYREENNVYLPAAWLRERGVAQERVVAQENVQESATVVERTANHAESFLDDAQTYLESVPETDGNRLAAWAIPYLLAVGTLRELTERPEDAVTGAGVKISRSEVSAIVSTMLSGAGRGELTELRETITREPFHQASY
jgi:farnesyl-diphosphate farnesyltransferase